MDPREHERLAEYEEWYWWHLARGRIVQRLLRPVTPAGARILDVGCGTGATTATLGSLGEVLGLDLGREAVAYTQRRGIPALRASALALPLAEGSFDVVVALDVLEHLDDDVAVLREVLRVLAPGGRFAATVPAYEWLWSGHDEALSHHRRYRRRQLRRLLESAGFEVEVCSYVMSPILPVAAVLRLSERLRGRPGAGTGYVDVPAPVNRLLTQVASLDGFLLHRVSLPFGLSVAALARRPAGSAGCAGGSG